MTEKLRKQASKLLCIENNDVQQIIRKRKHLHELKDLQRNIDPSIASWACAEMCDFFVSTDPFLACLAILFYTLVLPYLLQTLSNSYPVWPLQVLFHSTSVEQKFILMVMLRKNLAIQFYSYYFFRSQNMKCRSSFYAPHWLIIHCQQIKLVSVKEMKATQKAPLSSPVISCFCETDKPLPLASLFLRSS